MMVPVAGSHFSIIQLHESFRVDFAYTIDLGEVYLVEGATSLSHQCALVVLDSFSHLALIFVKITNIAKCRTNIL